jgi:hypothetical protein
MAPPPLTAEFLNRKQLLKTHENAPPPEDVAQLLVRLQLKSVFEQTPPPKAAELRTMTQLVSTPDKAPPPHDKAVLFVNVQLINVPETVPPPEKTAAPWTTIQLETTALEDSHQMPPPDRSS